MPERFLAPALRRLSPENAQGEYYLTDLPGKALSDGEAVETVAIPAEEAIGVNTVDQLAIIEGLMRVR